TASSEATCTGPRLPSIEMSSPTADTVVPNEALTAPQLPTSVQALQQAAEGLRQAGAAQATPGQAPIEAVDAGVSPVPAVPGAFPWLWLVPLVVVVGLAAVAGVWWWRRRTRKPRPALPKDTPESEFDPLREWNQFR